MDVEIVNIYHWMFTHSFPPTIDQAGNFEEPAADVRLACNDVEEEVYELLSSTTSSNSSSSGT